MVLNNDVMLQSASLIDCDTCVLMACGMYYTNCPMGKCLSYKIPLLDAFLVCLIYYHILYEMPFIVLVITKQFGYCLELKNLRSREPHCEKTKTIY